MGLGLGRYEAKVLTILFKEKINLRDLSKKSGVPFGKVYSVVKNLGKKGLVQETNSRPKLIYVENASEVISKLIKEKQDKEKMVNEKLREMTTKIDKGKKRATKFFQIGVSKEERREIQLRTWREAQDEILQILNIHHNPKVNRQSKIIYEKEIEQAVKRGVKIKYLFPKNKQLPKILEKLHNKKPALFQVRRLDTSFPRCDIVDGKKVLMKLAHEDVANSGGSIFVENEKLAENLIKIFNEMWEQASLE